MTRFLKAVVPLGGEPLEEGGGEWGQGQGDAVLAADVGDGGGLGAAHVADV